MKRLLSASGIALIASSLLLTSCNKNEVVDEKPKEIKLIEEDASSFKEVGSLDIGDEGAAEIAAYDTLTKQLFVVNNSVEGKPTVDVIDLTNPTAMKKVKSIDVTTYGAGINSVAVKNGMLAMAIEANPKTSPGKVVVLSTKDLTKKLAEITAGALPDMVTFSPDGKWILSANEGEPSDDYATDPEGTVTLIEVDGFKATQLNFKSFNSKEAELEKKGFRVFGPSATLAQDVEPEYIAVTKDSKKAFVSLQENNGMAVIDISSKTITDIFPFGTKDYSKAGNEIDPSDKDDKVEFRAVKAFGLYQPDAISAFNTSGVDYIISANEGDSREYEGNPGYVGEERVKKVDLDATAFPKAAELQKEENIGRLKMPIDLGKNADGKYEKIYSYGARSFSIWNTNGTLVYDCGNEMEKKTNKAGLYPDGRSDDKGVEPEGVTTGMVHKKVIAFVGMERANALAVCDVTNPKSPAILSILKTGEAPEGVLFIQSNESPNKKSLLIVSSEKDGMIKAYSPAK